jgi:hypothetical protein
MQMKLEDEKGGEGADKNKTLKRELSEISNH